MNKNRKYAIITILVTNAILISVFESMISLPIAVPGVKLGLANIITIIAIAFLPLKDVLLIVIMRCLVVAMLTRGVMMLAFSLSGGLLSALSMTLLFRKMYNFFSVKGISIIGAIVHNITQISAASLILGESAVLYYLPVLLISAVITGFITGSISEIAIAELKKKDYLKINLTEQRDEYSGKTGKINPAVVRKENTEKDDGN